MAAGEIEGLEVHALRHLHPADLLINNADQLDLHLLLAIAVEAVLAVAGVAALLASCEARTIFFVALGFFACAKYFLLRFEV